MHSVNVTREMNSDAATVWRYIDDFGSVYKYHPGVESSEILGNRETGLGAQRQCEFYDGTSLKEKITHYDEGRSYTLELSDYAMPLKSAVAHMEVTPTGTDKSRLSITLEFEPKFGPIGWLMGKLLMRPMLTKALKELTKGLDDHIRTGQFIGSKGELLAAAQ
jgi:carbon monoxide dehydrogenase subunit G